MKFPCGKHGRQRLEFFAAPFRPPLRAFAALVYPWREDEVLLSCIEDRGWCIPSGGVEPNETSEQAARREAIEEAGVTLGTLAYIGCCRLADAREVRWAEVYTAEVCCLGEIDPQFESSGRKFVRLNELPALYYCWDDLTEAMFNHAWDAIQRQRSVLGG